MRQLARDGMTMVIVTYEMGFARDAATRMVFIDRGQVVAVGQHVDQLLAHTHQRGGAAGREIEAPDELLATRLGGRMQIEHRLRVRSRAIGLDRQQ